LVGQTNARERSAAAGIPHTGRKLREAQLFFKKLAEYGKQFVGEPKEEVLYNLSAFQSAARSVSLVLQKEIGQAAYRPRLDGWASNQSADDLELMADCSGDRQRLISENAALLLRALTAEKALARLKRPTRGPSG